LRIVSTEGPKLRPATRKKNSIKSRIFSKAPLDQPSSHWPAHTETRNVSPPLTTDLSLCKRINAVEAKRKDAKGIAFAIAISSQRPKYYFFFGSKFNIDLTKVFQRPIRKSRVGCAEVYAAGMPFMMLVRFWGVKHTQNGWVALGRMPAVDEHP
jgi:hypothetical protein